MFEVSGLAKGFGTTPVFDEVSLTLQRGEIAVLSGANGAGKSTLCECLAGAQPYDAGTLRLHGEELRPTGRAHWRAVYGILDDFAWFPDLSVADHLRLLDPSVGWDRVEALAATLDAGLLLDRLPATLSSGQRQRCALLSAGVRDWSVLVVDEPERHLDADAVPASADFLRAQAERGTVLVASHHPSFTEAPAVRRLHLADGRVAPLR